MTRPRHTASPAARRLMAEHGLEPAAVRDPRAGRIQRRDVLAALAHPAGAQAFVDVDYGSVDAARPAGLGRLAFVINAACDGLRRFPLLNASSDAAATHHAVHVGVTAGRFTPVLRDAGDKALRALAREADELAARARAGSLAPEACTGATFTVLDNEYISTLVGVATEQHQFASLTVGGVTVQPVAVPADGDGYALALHPIGSIALTFGPGVVDVDYAAAFLRRVKLTLETRDWSAELVG